MKELNIEILSITLDNGEIADAEIDGGLERVMLKWKSPLEVFPVIMYARLSLKPRGGTFKSSEPETDPEPCLEIRTILQQTIAHITLRGTS